jgi:hypothetical protein
MFRQFENTDDTRERERIARQAVMELMVHAEIEEQIFYPAVRRQTRGEREMEEKMNEADEEHHVAEMLMEELSSMRPNDPHFQAKFMVLAENVKHHIQEEESEVLPKAAEAGRDRLDQLGSQMQERKMELMEQFQSNGSTPRRRTGRTTRSRSTGGRTTRTGGTRSRATGGTRSRSTGGTRSRSTGGTRTRASTSRSTTSRSRGGTRSSESGRGRTSRSRTTAGARSTSRGTARGGTRSRSQATRSRTGTRTRSTGTRTRRTGTGSRGGSRRS